MNSDTTDARAEHLLVQVDLYLQFLLHHRPFFRKPSFLGTALGGRSGLPLGRLHGLLGLAF